MSSLAPLTTNERIADSVFDRLRAAILAGELAPGSRLSVPALANELNVSRSPVREAVQRLTAERLAYEEPRRGCFVAELNSRELLAVYDVREVLEGLAARRAAETGDAVFHQQLRDLMEQHRAAIAAGDIERHVALDIAFHQMIRDTAGNNLLSEVLDSISGLVQLAIRTTSTFRTGPGNIALAEHEQICAAILDNDPDRAEYTARAHIRRMSQNLHDHIEHGAAAGEQVPATA